MISDLYAMAGPASPSTGGAAGILNSILPFIFIFAILYFLIIRPQQKKAKEHQNFLSNLKRGDYVITSGGLYGRILSLTDKVISLEVADNLKVKIARSFVSGSALEDAPKGENS